MFVAGWGDNVEMLATAGPLSCDRCNNNAEHALVDVRKKISVMFVPVAKLRKGKFLVCTICLERTSVSDADAAAIVQAAIQRDA